jgi:hypothetical protein
LKTATPVTINILKGAYSTETRTISTQLPDGQDSRGLISFAITTRIKPNLHWKISLEVSGFEDIGLKCWHAYLSDD